MPSPRYTGLNPALIRESSPTHVFLEKLGLSNPSSPSLKVTGFFPAQEEGVITCSSIPHSILIIILYWFYRFSRAFGPKTGDWMSGR